MYIHCPFLPYELQRELLFRTMLNLIKAISAWEDLFSVLAAVMITVLPNLLSSFLMISNVMLLPPLKL